MTILGIDPGSRRIGYGLIEKTGQNFTYIEAGLLSIKSKSDETALQETKESLQTILKAFQPEICAVEKLYFVRNQTTGIAVGQTRGVIMLTLVEAGIPIKEFSPNEIKSKITGHGLSDKKSVEKMVALLLRQKDLRLIDDAWDALAIALSCGFTISSSLSTA